MSGSILDDAYALIFSSQRMIGTVMPHVVVEEVHRDQLVLTDHPVERGAAITDHAFKMPSQIEMRCGWSNSTAGLVGYVQLVYQELLSLQASRVPFTVVTGKRIYSNMLIETLEVSNDERTENALMVVAGLREVIIVSTSTTAVPASNQASPEKTSSIINTGTKSLQPVDPSTIPHGRQTA